MPRKRHPEKPAETTEALSDPKTTAKLATPEIRTPRMGNEDALDAALRPRNFDEYIGQKKVTDNLKIFVEAARKRGEALDHVLFCGPPGLGKTTLAHLIAGALHVGLRPIGAPAIDHKGTLASYLTGLSERDVLFIDEIHRLHPVVEEYLYPAMEDFRIEIPLGDGPAAQLIHMSLPRFTLVGATTRTGLLTSPLRDRFGIVLRLEYYQPEDLAQIVLASAKRLEIPITKEASFEVGKRSRGTPRIANRLLRRVRDYAQVEGTGEVTAELAHSSLTRLGVDPFGLDDMDRAMLKAIIERFDGGPVGIESLAAAVSEESDTLEDVYEPFLIQAGFLVRTSRGRVAARKAYEHLKIPVKSRFVIDTEQQDLFS